MMRYIILFLLLAAPAFANDLPQRPLFRPSGAMPVTSAPVPSISGPVATATGSGISSFMYFAPDKWSFWWQGQRVTPSDIPAGISDIDVTQNAIRFTQNGTAHEFLFGKFN